jgi:fibronectin-binding autotransporter adhesin
MADRFWRGGTAAWDGTAGTKWAATVGGAGGASVPTSADDVFFDATSGTVTCTISAGNTGAKSINCTGFTGTLAGATAITVSGSVTLATAMTFTYSGTLTLAGTGTITSAGKTFLCPTTINGSGITVTLGDALTNNSGGNFLVSTGTFDTNNFNLTLSGSTILNSSAVGNVRAINLGSSTVSITAGGTALSFAFNSGLTFNAGTSTIICSGTSAQITGGAAAGGTGVTFYNVQFTATAVSTHNIVSSNTFNNLTVTSPAAAGVTQFTFDSRQTINGTLSTTGTAGNRRVWFRGVTYGIAQTLTINSAPSLTDADFRDIYVIGTAAPISGTRIGDLRGIRGITASTPKTVYWNLAGTNALTANAWASTSGGTPSTDNFPLAQDIAVINNSSAGSTIQTLASSTPMAMPTIDASLRTTAITLDTGTSTYYGDFKLGSGVTITGASVSTFSGRNIQTITSAGKAFAGGITVDSYGGTVQLADALNIGSNAITVTNGTFSTQNYNVTAGFFSSNNTNVRTVNLGSSTLSITSSGSSWNVGATPVNLTFNAVTSQINLTQATSPIFGNVVYYNVSFTATSAQTISPSGSATFNNLTFTAPASAGLMVFSFAANQTITGTLTCAGATAVRRIFLRSDTLGTQRDLTVGTLVATDCDFRDIEILGAAIGTAPTRAGDCGGNNNITFPSPKTVYWSLAGSQNWTATAWATSSGGTPNINNFPLAQDTAVFDNAVAVTTASITASWNIGTLDMSGRTSAMTFNIVAASPSIYGNFLFGTGITPTGTVAIIFSGRGTQTITSNGIASTFPITIDSFSGTVQLADALSIDAARTLTLTSGTFDAVTYNVTTGLMAVSGTAIKTLKMGSGTWTLSGTGSVWTLANVGTTFFKGSADIVLSNTSTTARTFGGGNFSYNKLTIGGATGISTLTINDTNQFTELASTKTVAHTIALGTTTQTFGAWTVTGTAGNVVTVTGTATLTIAGARVSGVDYLAMGTTTVSATSPGEFYSGANSTGTGTGIIKTAAPTPVTRYWRGGTGTWDATTTTNWSDTSGGAGGFSVPTSADAVVFDTLSNATAYTVTCTATQLRCGSLTMAGPAAGNVTWAGTAPLAIHDNVSLAATGITRSYTGAITLSGSTTGKTFTTNGVSVVSPVTVNGVGCGWSLGSAWVGSSTFTITNGAFDTANYSLIGSLVSSNSNTRSINLGSSAVTLPGATAVSFAISANLSFNAGTSTLTATNSGSTLDGGGQTFYDVSFNSTAANTVTIAGANTFNDLSFTGITAAGLKVVSINANQTINGTLTLSAGTNATCRTFVRSDTIGTTRTLTCAAVAAPTDIDFRDIIIAGAAAPVSGTRLGDCKGNSGITFPAAKTVYWSAAANGNWGSGFWGFTDAGSPDATAFPLAQDTIVFGPRLGSGGTVTVNAAYNIGTIDMSARTSNTMTLATGSTTPQIYGNWINGTGTTLTGTGRMTFAGRNSQAITSAGRTFTQTFTIQSPNGSVTFQDAFTTNVGSNFELFAGTVNGNNYNVTLSGSGSQFAAGGISPRTVALGSGVWTVAGAVWSTDPSTNCTVTGTGTISLTSASAKTFAGGGISYSGITLDQGGAGTLTITGNNTFANISNTYKATGATTIAMGTTTQTVGNFTASGEAGRVLTVQGTSASSPATLVFSGAGIATTPTTDYLAITGVRAYNLATTWYAGANSTNNGSLGWYFAVGGGGPIAVYITEAATAADAQSAAATLYSATSETTTAADAAAAGLVYIGTLSESATVADITEAFRAFLATVSESTTVTDLITASLTLAANISELTTAAESLAVQSVLTAPVSELVVAADSISGGLLFLSDIAEAVTAADTAAALLIFNRTISEATTAAEVLAAVATFQAAVPESVVGSDVAQALLTVGGAINEALTALDEAAAVATFQAAVPESVVGSDVAQALLTVGGAINEALTALDEAAATATITAYVGSLPQDMAPLPVGTSAAGSLVFDSSSFIDGAAVFANGTGTGSTGGFDLDGNYLGFAYAGPGLYAEAITPNISWLDIVGIRVDLIAGTGANGGPLPNGDMDVSLVTTVGPYTVYDTIALITKDAADTLISVMIPVSAYYRVASGKLSFKPNSPAPTTTPSWAIKSFTIYYGGATGTDSTTNTYIANPSVAETTHLTDAAAVAASTFSASSSETASPLDTVQGANTGTSTLSESVTASETASTAFNPSTQISEAAQQSDSVSAVAAFYAQATELSTATEASAVAPSVFSAVALAAAQAAESLSPSGVYNVVLAAETATASSALRRSKVIAVSLEDYIETGAGVSVNTVEVQLLSDAKTSALVSYNELFATFLGIHYETTQAEVLNSAATTASVSRNEIFAKVLSVPTAVKRS